MPSIERREMARTWTLVPMSAKLPESALVRIDRHPVAPVDVPFEEIEPLVRTAFGQRRKMLRKSLAGVVDPSTFAAADVDPRDRPERIGLDGWARLAMARR